MDEPVAGESVELLRAGYGQDRGPAAELAFLSTEWRAAWELGRQHSADAVLVIMWAKKRDTGRVVGTSWHLVLPDTESLTGEALREWLQRWAREGAASAMEAAARIEDVLTKAIRMATETGPGSAAITVLKRSGSPLRAVWTRDKLR